MVQSYILQMLPECFFQPYRSNFFSEKNLSFCHTILVRCYNSRIYSRLTKVFVQEESVIICQTSISASKRPNYQTFSKFDRLATHLSSIRHVQVFKRVRVANIRIWAQKHVKQNHKHARQNHKHVRQNLYYVSLDPKVACF